MGRLGLILGSGASGLLSPGEEAGVAVVERHGRGEYVLPHRIDHAANLRALADAGCDRVLGVASAGSLSPELEPGTFLCPHDFVALDPAPASVLEGPEAHRVAGFDPEWRGRVVAAWGRVAPGLVDGGVYWQVSGPRLETPAEVRFIAAHAEVVGMTVASECVVAGELGLAYAAVCAVDNFANGIAERELTHEQVRAGQRAHRERLREVLEALVTVL